MFKYLYGCGSKPMVPFWGRRTVILVYFSGDWDVYWYGVLTHGHIFPISCRRLFLAPRKSRRAATIWWSRQPRVPTDLQAGSPGSARSRSSALSHPFLGEGSPSKIDYRKKGTLILPLYWRTLSGKAFGGDWRFGNLNPSGSCRGYMENQPLTTKGI